LVDLDCCGSRLSMDVLDHASSEVAGNGWMPADEDDVGRG
jgi:hypothetical protein